MLWQKYSINYYRLLQHNNVFFNACYDLYVLSLYECDVILDLVGVSLVSRGRVLIYIKLSETISLSQLDRCFLKIETI
jgi:hypothetical protein